MKVFRFLHALLLCTLVASPLFAGAKSDARLSSVLQRSSAEDQVVAWVLFADKGSSEAYTAAVLRSVVSPRSFLRRLKSRTIESAVDYTDLPVEHRYVQQVASQVAQVRQVSKWFNGVSVVATKLQLAELESLPFVRSLELVARFKRDKSIEEITPTPAEVPLTRSKTTSSIDYGQSFAQLNLINVPAVHEMGNYGQGVIVGVFDNGFRLLEHEAFDTLRTRIVGTYDFVDHKVSVVPRNTDAGFGAHGIVTLSALAGYKPGQLVGPAFGASFILARTENDSSETPFEEDNWVAAIEWADSIGVDVTSTSLGYLTYDSPFASWTWQDMDGNTTRITRAADMAVSKGIVVVNSAGNNGFNSAHNTLNAPSDGDSVLSIGAATIDGQRAGFSSIGPTTSNPPRIKPDLMAQGVTVRCASWTTPNLYAYSQGTSLACPLAAGVAALLLSAKPTASPLEIADAMRRTASRANAADNLYGWGIINARSAVTSLTGIKPLPTSYALQQNYPNPFNPTTRIEYHLPQNSFVTLKVYNLLGQEVRALVNEEQPQKVYEVEWNGTNNSGNFVASDVYFYRLTATSAAGRFSETRKLIVVR